MTMNKQGRPTAPGTTDINELTTISGDRGLDHEEGLIFELGRKGMTGVDVPDVQMSEIGGVSLVTSSFFNEFTIRLPKPAVDVVNALAARNIIAGVPAWRLMPHETAARDLLIVAATETNTDEDCDAFGKTLAEVL